MDELLLKKGARFLFGKPTNPIDAQATGAITEAIAGIQGIHEAYLPQCFAEDVSKAPSQVLVLVLAPSTTPARVMQQLGPELHKIIPKGIFLGVLPLGPTDQVLGAVRKAGCEIYRAPNRPWWRFW